jgi:hypothetical protein
MVLWPGRWTSFQNNTRLDIYIGTPIAGTVSKVRKARHRTHQEFRREYRFPPLGDNSMNVLLRTKIVHHLLLGETCPFEGGVTFCSRYAYPRNVSSASGVQRF